jgi:diguanylate cyclase (GGDEF)-like protein
VLPALIAVVAISLATLVAAPLAPMAQARVSWLLSLLFSAGTIIAAWHTARRLDAGNPARRFWWAMNTNACAIGIKFGIQFVTAQRPADGASGPAVQALGGFGALALVVIMLTYPLRIESRRERVCFWLDLATVMVGAAAFGWYLTDPTADLGAGLLRILTGPVIMLVAVFAVAKLLIAGRPPFGVWPGLLGAAAATTGGVIAVLGQWQETPDYSNWYFALSALGDAFLMIATWVQWLQIKSNPDALERRRRPFSTLPYVAVAGTFVLLTVALEDRGLDDRTWTVLAGAVCSTGLVVLRQLATFAENARLLDKLDLKVRELHEIEAVLRSALHERDALANRLHDMAFYDGLTGLANRSLFHDELAVALTDGGHPPDTVVMLLDLDDFKPINDRFGHAAGDAVLREVARRIRDCVGRRDTAARLGGDEFAVILRDRDPESVVALAQRMVTEVSRACWVDAVPLTVGVSIGLACARPGQVDAERLLNHADTAMYRAKKNGKNSLHVYQDSEPAGAGSEQAGALVPP